MSVGEFQIPQGFYPQNDAQQYRPYENPLERWIAGGLRRFSMNAGSETRFVKGVLASEARLAALDSKALQEQLRQLRYRVRKVGLDEGELALMFAIIRESAVRTLGVKHFASQIAGAWAMIQGRVIEMDTGEGKSLCATLAAASAALLGVPVHILTVNEYLAGRDAEQFRRLYEFLRLTVGSVCESMAEQDKRTAYLCDIVYCTNKQITFDYLRDRITLQNRDGILQLQLESLYAQHARHQGLILRGLHFAIVDEADSIFVDEAITPLIISAVRDKGQRRAFYSRALLMARQLQHERDYLLRPRERLIHFTAAGTQRMATIGAKWGGLWSGRCPRNELVEQALKALHFFVPGQHYLIQDGKIVIVDEFTGRIMADRSWESGLHQLIELKEGCEMTEERETLAKISYQRFFTRYVNLAGMTGTAMEIRGDLRRVYGLDVYRIRRQHPSSRHDQPICYFATQDEKWRAVVLRVKRLHEEGRACLVGTRTVAASQHLHRLLTDHGVPHQLLNAENPQQEAEIVAQAGRPAQITIATNMAGRGTDIKINDAVRQLGGLHVIATEKHESGRIDRQLFGRCARQNDPGRVEVYLSLEDELVVRETARWVRGVAQRAFACNHRLACWLVALLFLISQRAIGRRMSRTRRNVLKLDSQQTKMLAFSGRRE